MDNYSFNQLYIFSVFILTGILIAILFDIFRILRKSFKTSDIVTYFEDITFWILAGLILLYTIFKFNNGKIRIYIFLAIFTGILIYMLFFSKPFIKINVTIISVIKKILSKLISVLIFPIKVIINTLRKIFIKPISIVCINIRNFFTNYTKLNKKILKKLKKNMFKTKNDKIKEGF